MKEEEFDDNMFIVELDERLEFGVAVLSSRLQPDTNTQCYNGAGCTDGNATHACVNGTFCAG
jgi:hypothetical protein